MSGSAKSMSWRNSELGLGSGASLDLSPTDLITVTETARLLRLSRRSIERLVSRGVLPFYALPVRGGLRFDRVAVLQWLASRHRESLEAK